MNDSIIQRLKEWGCDTDGAVARLLGDRQLYVSFIYKYAAKFDVGGLGCHIDSRKRDAAFAVAHDLKGSAGNLGITPIASLAGDITERLRGKSGSFDGVDELYERLRTVYDEFLRLIERP